MSVSASITAAQATLVSTLLRDRCDVMTPVKGASDGRFGWAAGTPVAAYNNLPCLVQAPSLRIEEGPVAQRLQGRSFVTIRLPVTTTITMGQTIRRGNETYEVIGTPVMATNGLTLEVPVARNT